MSDHPSPSTASKPQPPAFIPPPPPPPPAQPVHQLVSSYQSRDLLYVLLMLRALNALAIFTFFQPDEYYQVLEPAWQLAFGRESGAWITWEWPHQLRSSLHPMLFAAVYVVGNAAMGLLHVHHTAQGIMMAYLPGVAQSGFAMLTDYFTWRLAERIYGRSANAPLVALWMSVLSPWQFFCSTRPFSNSLEAALTVMALYFWPWQLAGQDESKGKPGKAAPMADWSSEHVTHLRYCLLLAGFACVLRPTNLLIWVPLVLTTFTHMGLVGAPPVTSTSVLIVLRETVLCGSAVLAASAASDKCFYGEWTFPAYQWLQFNLVQDLAVFYGHNPWHYYLSQGLPLLLTTYLPAAVYALWAATALPSPGLSSLIVNARFQLAFCVLTMIATLSLIAHKEVRFIYPLLPLLHVLAAPHVLAMCMDTTVVKALVSETAYADLSVKSRKLLVWTLVLVNLAIAGYTAGVHQRGVLNAVAFIRMEYERVHLTSMGALIPEVDARTAAFQDDTYGVVDHNETFAAFLMPCHSTPWRSHLVYPGLHAWALTCEPPLDIPPHTPARAAYRDEADRFYDDPITFLQREVNTPARPWPRYVVGFEGIEPWLREYYEAAVPGWQVREKWRSGNTHWHDDWRRQGDVVVWEFVDGARAAS